MAWNRDKDTSTEPFHRQNNRYDVLNRQESVDNQQTRAVKETSRILQDITGSPKGYSLPSGGEWPKNKRIPRLYSINKNQTILIILQGDITRTKVDAIVNAANEHMTGGSGVDGIIHHAAGNELYDACKAHKQISRGVRLPTGHSRILLSYNMSPMPYYIINTAGPMYSSYKAKQCAEELSSCYQTSLALANLYDLESIGFTAISCGIFGYPAKDGADVALLTVNEKADSLPVVVFVLWDDHIYDAWIQKAKELKFTPFNFESTTTTTTNSTKPSVDNEQGKIVQNPTVNDDPQKSSIELTLPASDLSAQNEEEKTPESKSESLFHRLPSVPGESSDTQRTECIDHDDNSMDTNNLLTTQKTVEMTNFNAAKEDSTTNDNSQQQPAQEGINKLEDEKAKNNTIEDEPHQSATADTPQNVN